MYICGFDFILIYLIISFLRTSIYYNPNRSISCSKIFYREILGKTLGKNKIFLLIVFGIYGTECLYHLGFLGGLVEREVNQCQIKYSHARINAAPQPTFLSHYVSSRYITY